MTDSTDDCISTTDGVSADTLHLLALGARREMTLGLLVTHELKLMLAVLGRHKGICTQYKAHVHSIMSNVHNES